MKPPHKLPPLKTTFWSYADSRREDWKPSGNNSAVWNSVCNEGCRFPHPGHALVKLIRQHCHGWSTTVIWAVRNNSVHRSSIKGKLALKTKNTESCCHLMTFTSYENGVEISYILWYLQFFDTLKDLPHFFHSSPSTSSQAHQAQHIRHGNPIPSIELPQCCLRSEQVLLVSEIARGGFHNVFRKKWDYLSLHINI